MLPSFIFKTDLFHSCKVEFHSTLRTKKRLIKYEEEIKIALIAALDHCCTSPSHAENPFCKCFTSAKPFSFMMVSAVDDRFPLLQ